MTIQTARKSIGYEKPRAPLPFEPRYTRSHTQHSPFMPQSKKIFPFLSLPAEVRNTIYEYAVCSCYCLDENDEHNNIYTFCAGTAWPTPFPAILRVSSQIRAEALPFFYHIHVFQYTDDDEEHGGRVLRYFLNVVPHEHLKHFTSIQWLGELCTDDLIFMVGGLVLLQELGTLGNARLVFDFMSEPGHAACKLQAMVREHLLNSPISKDKVFSMTVEEVEAYLYVPLKTWARAQKYSQVLCPMCPGGITHSGNLDDFPQQPALRKV